MKKIILIALLLGCGGAACATFPSGNTVLITGSNRGIGLGLAEQFAKLGWNVIATARDPDTADELQDLASRHKNVAVEELDVTDFDQVDRLADKYRDQPIDILLNNAAFTPPYSVSWLPFEEIDLENTRRSFDVNVIGPIKITQAFLANVEASGQKKIVNISSGAASFNRGQPFGTGFNYISSKAALNMFTYQLAAALKDRGIVVVCLHPGVVETNRPGNEPDALPEMARRIPSISVAESATSIVKLVTGLTPEQSGKFLNYADGAVIPW